MRFRKVKLTDDSIRFYRDDVLETDARGRVVYHREIPVHGVLVESSRGQMAETFTDVCGGCAGVNNSPLEIDSTPVVAKSSVADLIKDYQKILNCGVAEAAILAGCSSREAREMGEAASTPSAIAERAERWMRFAPALTKAECRKFAELGKEPQ
ncbi:MAG: hypothetical protein ACRD3L_10925 [Terriglobales bacterium]